MGYSPGNTNRKGTFKGQYEEAGHGVKHKSGDSTKRENLRIEEESFLFCCVLLRIVGFSAFWFWYHVSLYTYTT